MSQPVDWIGKEYIGYVINAAFSEKNSKVITDWLNNFEKHFSAGIYPMSPKSLHITVVDWLAPLYDYNKADKIELYKKLRPAYDVEFRNITKDMKPFKIRFNEIRVTPTTIILVGQDHGQLKSIRQKFTESVTLPEGGKQPPSIIHSSIARFTKPELELAAVQRYALNHPIDIKQEISEFRLVKTNVEPMQKFEILDIYKLGQ